MNKKHSSERISTKLRSRFDGWALQTHSGSVWGGTRRPKIGFVLILLLAVILSHVGAPGLGGVCCEQPEPAADDRR